MSLAEETEKELLHFPLVWLDNHSWMCKESRYGLFGHLLGEPSTTISWWVLLSSSKCLNWESFGDASKALKVNFSSRWVINNYLTNRKPEHEFLGLHSLEFLDLLLANITSYFSVIAYELADHLEVVFNLFLLCNPHISGIPDKSNFAHICKREQSKRKSKLLEKSNCHFQSFIVTLLDNSSFLPGHG